MLYTISNGTYTAQVDSLGAQLVSLKGPDGWEYIWTGDPAYWTGHAPVLFPMVGACGAAGRKSPGTGTRWARHGFAATRSSPWRSRGRAAWCCGWSPTPPRWKPTPSLRPHRGLHPHGERL